MLTLCVSHFVSLSHVVVRMSLVVRHSCFFFQAEDGIRDLVRSRGLGDVYKRQDIDICHSHCIAVFQKIYYPLPQLVVDGSQYQYGLSQHLSLIHI